MYKTVVFGLALFILIACEKVNAEYANKLISDKSQTYGNTTLASKGKVTLRTKINGMKCLKLSDENFLVIYTVFTFQLPFLKLLE